MEGTRHYASAAYDQTSECYYHKVLANHMANVDYRIYELTQSSLTDLSVFLPSSVYSYNTPIRITHTQPMDSDSDGSSSAEHNGPFSGSVEGNLSMIASLATPVVFSM